jgi:hypothetical protein
MKDLILSVQSEGVTTVIFHGQTDKAVIRTIEQPINSDLNAKKYKLYLYHGSTQIFNESYPMLPDYLLKQIRKAEIPIIAVFQKGLTVQQAQDLYDLSV